MRASMAARSPSRTDRISSHQAKRTPSPRTHGSTARITSVDSRAAVRAKGFFARDAPLARLPREESA